jgi:hypothetical protein
MQATECSKTLPTMRFSNVDLLVHAKPNTVECGKFEYILSPKPALIHHVPTCTPAFSSNISNTNYTDPNDPLASEN